jgi:hypothetical protein
MKKNIILLVLVLFLGSCTVSKTYSDTNTLRPSTRINSDSKINPYVKNKDKNSYEKTYKKHIKIIKSGVNK